MNGAHPTSENNTIVDALKAAGLQVTGQRLAVYRAVEAKPHAMAEELWQVVQAEIGAVSRQTVFDTLNTMSEHGIIRRIHPTGAAARYEHRVDNHHHVVCRACGTLADVDCAIGSAPCLVASNDHGYQIDEAEVIYRGLCPECQE